MQSRAADCDDIDGFWFAFQFGYFCLAVACRSFGYSILHKLWLAFIERFCCFLFALQLTHLWGSSDSQLWHKGTWNRLEFLCSGEVIGSTSIRNWCDLVIWYEVVIHPASRGGPPTPQVFWFSPCKDIEHASKFFLQCFLIAFLQHPRNLYIFGHKVGPKHRFLQCCFNLFFKTT